MRIAYITAGAAGSYCGACTRDVALARGLTALGHDIQLVPLYTPIRADGDDPSLPRVFYGAVNVCLDQASGLFRRAPRPVRWLLDRPALLRFVSRFAVRTRPADLGEMTVSVLEGEHGRQRRELDELLAYLEGERPDVVNLTNSLLSGLAGPVRERLGCAVVCTLQGEEYFIRGLAPPHDERALAALRERARDVDAFVAPSDAYADEMAELLAVPRDRIRTVRFGIEAEGYARSHPRPRDPFTIGYLGRMAHSKGLDVVCGAFRTVEAARPGAARLRLAGRAAGPDADLWAELHTGLERDGLGDRVDYLGEPDLPGKVDFMHSASVVCLPERFSEPRGTVCLEALAAGVPVVVPELGVFPEIIGLTGGGICVAPDDAGAAADALLALLDDPDRADAMGRAGAEGVARHYSADRMARETLALYEGVAGA